MFDDSAIDLPGNLFAAESDSNQFFNKPISIPFSSSTSSMADDQESNDGDIRKLLAPDRIP